MSAIQSFAAWSPLGSTSDRAVAAGYLAAANRLEHELHRAGAQAIGPIDFKVSENHAIFDDPDLDQPRAVLLAEVRAIVLLDPPAFPRIRLFPRFAVLRE